MNQPDKLENNSPTIEVKTFKPISPVDELKTNDDATPAPAQIVADISATPAEILESAFPVETKEEAGDETAHTVETQSAASPAPSETGVYRLANAMVGKSYRAEIDLKNLKIENSILSPNFAEQLTTLNLSVKRANDVLRIEGTPRVDAQGEHALFLDYTYDRQRVHRKKFVLLINPDPKSLWKTLEPDAAQPFRKEHSAVKQIVGENFKIIAASRRGRSHAHEAKFREDDFAVSALENGWHVLIVADGAGSARLSREGSRLACQTGLEFLEKSIGETLEPKFAELMRETIKAKTETTEKEIKNLLYRVLCGAAFAAYKRLENASAETGNALKDYSTTFLASVVKKYEQKIFVAAFGIGDGAIGLLGGNGFELLNVPDGGEFSGQTRFLTMREVIGDGSEMLKRIKFAVFDKVTMLALMTDGISDPIFGTDKNLLSAEKWRDFAEILGSAVDFSDGNANEQLLEWMDFWSPGEHDDRTLAILCPDI